MADGCGECTPDGNGPCLHGCRIGYRGATEVLRTAEGWAFVKGFRVRDPDGWRTEDAPAWSALITEAEFIKRAASSTVEHRPGVGNFRGVS